MNVDYCNYDKEILGIIYDIYEIYVNGEWKYLFYNLDEMYQEYLNNPQDYEEEVLELMRELSEF